MPALEPIPDQPDDLDVDNYAEPPGSHVQFTHALGVFLTQAPPLPNLRDNLGFQIDPAGFIQMMRFLLHHSRFKTRTFRNQVIQSPPFVCNLVQQLLHPTDSFIIDLMAGSGSLLYPYAIKHPQHRYDLIEKKEARVNEGRKTIPQGNWHLKDIFDQDFINAYVIQRTEYADVVVSNPDFRTALAAIYLASHLIKPDGRLIFVLPSDYFGPQRRQLYAFDRVKIIHAYPMGNQPYYPGKPQVKHHGDSVYVMKLRDRKLINAPLTQTERTYQTTFPMPTN